MDDNVTLLQSWWLGYLDTGSDDVVALRERHRDRVVNSGRSATFELHR